MCAERAFLCVLCEQKAFINSVVVNGCSSVPKQRQFDGDSFPNKDDKETKILVRMPKTSVKSKAISKLIKILMITDTIQCKSCYNNATHGHTWCKSGLVLVGATDEVKKQILKNVINCFDIFRTSAFVSLSGKLTRKTVGRSEGSQLYHQAREHYKGAVTERAVQTHSRVLPERQLVSTENSVTRYDRRASEMMGPSCRRTKQRTLRYRTKK